MHFRDKDRKNEIIYFASDLTIDCDFNLYLTYKNLLSGVKEQILQSSAKLLQKKGYEYEKFFLEKLKSEGKKVFEINIASKDRVAETQKAIKEGCEVIYQGVLEKDNWQGTADFLIRVDKKSLLGNYSYEVLDVKLTKKVEPKHIIQLCLYSELLAEILGSLPKSIHLFLGNGEIETFKLMDFFSYYKKSKNKFTFFMEEIIKSEVNNKLYPKPCSYCKLCNYTANCQEIWQKDRHLCLIANITNNQISNLQKNNIQTIQDLADCETDIENFNKEVFARLKMQAKLQNFKNETKQDKFEIINCGVNKGFVRFVKPAIGDLFFDMEGDPLYKGGLEYLFGVLYFEQEEEYFKTFWGHNHDEERTAFIDFMIFLKEHFKKYPDAYIYHYNHYETTALKKLASKYAVFEEDLNNLLRKHKFIDLYIIVREAIMISEDGYSIKNLERFYMEKRENDVKNAVDSIVVYNLWQEIQDDDLLKEIENYNKIDCISTKKLRDWLIKIKPIETGWFEVEEYKAEEILKKDWEIEYEKFKKLLEDNYELNKSEVNLILADLLEFHNREDKPKWWSIFDRQNKADYELIDDQEVIACLEMFGEPVPEKRSFIHNYKFPKQDFKLKKGDKVINCSTLEKNLEIYDINKNIVQIKSSKQDLPKFLSVASNKIIGNKSLRAGIYKVAQKFLDGKKGAIFDILNRSFPKFKNRQMGDKIIKNEKDLTDEVFQALNDLDNSYLFIQGPPGAGKTYISSHVIVNLLKSGKKIGISSNSHHAIDNMLSKVEEVAIKNNFTFRGLRKDESSKKEYKFVSYANNSYDINEYNLFAGTAWFFSGFEGELDYLFIDEAGQVSLANIVAMSNSTKNIILIGDQMQLSQPTIGTHPGEASKSILEFLLENKSTIEENRGIFLAKTFRMNKEICKFISDNFYDSKLNSDEIANSRKLNLKNIDLPNSGIKVIFSEHENCVQKSVEEAQIIKENFEKLLGQEYTDNVKRKINIEDILVLSPYNVQVNYLQSILPNGARVGTVDKFQGQEAPIVLISLVSSKAEESKNIEFLYSKNRLNVAISRAQCLVAIVMNRNLFEINCKTIKQMQLVNSFCNLENYSLS